MSGLIEAIRRLRDDPVARLREAGVGAGMTVADVGAGYGYFAIPAATIVGQSGLVYAVEPNPDRAKRITQAASEKGIKNIVVTTAPAEQMTEIPSGAVDLAMAISSVHHFTDIEKALTEIRRIVRPGGRVYIRDMKAGRIIRHGSNSQELRRTLGALFPGTSFKEDSRHITAMIRIPAERSPPT